MIIVEFFKLLIETIAMFFTSILKAMFEVSDAVDSVKFEMIAAVLGVSAGFVSVVFTIIGVVSFIIKRIQDL